MTDQRPRERRSLSFSIGPGELVSLDGYRGDGICRVIRVTELDGTHLKGECVLRSSPTEPRFRCYVLAKIDGFRQVVGQVATSD